LTLAETEARFFCFKKKKRRKKRERNSSDTTQRSVFLQPPPTRYSHTEGAKGPAGTTENEKRRVIKKRNLGQSDS
jgi:hypothetical protein